MAEQSGRPQARRSLFGFAAAALMGLALAGCQLVPKPAPERPPEPERPVPEQPARPDPVTPGLPKDETHNRVAVLVPLTGTNAGVGQSIANAANLALLDTGGARIRITIYDTAKGAAEAANQALADGNGLFLGPLLAEDVRVIAPIARRADVPVVSFSNDTSVAGAGVYLMGFNPAQSVERVVAHARSTGVDRFSALVPEGVYGRRAADATIAAVRASGGTLTGMQTYDRAPAALRTAISRLNDQGVAQAVLIADSARSAASAAPLIRSGPSGDARLLGTELWAAEDNPGANAALRGAWYAAVSDNLFNQLRTRYRARYGSNPYRLASLGYDAVLLAIRIAQDWPVGRDFPERALRDRQGFVGVDGAFRFDSNGIAERALEVREVAAGAPRIVSPAPRGFD
ncbi:MAG: penicillin-binding protein activator [Allosphingosinicella sp.]